MSRETGKRVAGGDAPKRKKPKRESRLTRQQKVLLVVAICLAVILAAVAACQSLFVRPDNSGGSEDKEEIDYGLGISPKVEGQRKSEDYYTILILGRDTGGGGNTDTMLLASYDVTNQKASVMSIPRDTMVNVGWDVKKINSVYNWSGGGDDGIRALYKEISQLVGFEPDYQVVVEWEAVGQLVDAIGGVYFDVPYEMDYHDPTQDLSIEQRKGYRLLTGDDAMEVIRWRKNDRYSPYGYIEIGDSGRMALQQDFLKAVIQQLMKPSNVLNISKIARVFQDSVETDLTFQEILWFGRAAVSGGLGVEDVEFFTMPYTDAAVWSRSYEQKLAYVMPSADALLEAVNTKLSPFAEEFALEELDIMYVNPDGSIGSTSGHVEDSEAALPPVIPVKPAEPEPEKPTETETPEVPEQEGSIVIDPETGTPETETPEQETPEAETPTEPPTNPPTEAPEPPAVQEPQPPAEPETPEFIIIEPLPAA